MARKPRLDRGKRTIGETLTLGLRSRGASDRDGQGIDGESPDGEEGKSSFEEHGDMKCEEEQITTAPGLKFRR